MDFLTILSYALAIIETGALLMALVFVTKISKEKKAIRQKKQNVPVDKSNYLKAAAFAIVYVVLNMIRAYGIIG